MSYSEDILCFLNDSTRLRSNFWSELFKDSKLSIFGYFIELMGDIVSYLPGENLARSMFIALFIILY